MQLLWKLPEISLKPELLFNLGPIPVTNTLLCTWIAILAILAIFFFGTRKRDMIPSGMQNVVEWGIELLLGLVEGIAGKEKGRRFFPLITTFFIFILFCNLIDLIPGVDTIGSISGENARHIAESASKPVAGFLLFGDISNQITPWFRPPTSDLNLTLSLAVVSVVVTQVFGFIYLGAGEHLSKYVNLKGFVQNGKFSLMGIIDLFIGVVEIISEFSRLISFSIRLFGNLFAGSILLAVFAFLIPFVGTIPFLGLELFVAFVQALVFSLLTLIFLQIGTTSHSGQHGEHAEDQQSAEEHFEANKEGAALTAAH